MKSDDVITRTMEYVKNTLMGENSGHDWWHAYRVWSVAKTIAAHEGGNLLIIELAALLHDIADWKFHDGESEAGVEKVRAWLHTLPVELHITEDVCEIVGKMSFKGAAVKEESTLSLEGRIVQDADRLDAIGAIGIARVFAYGGATGRMLYAPMIQPVQHKTAEAYFTNQGPSINHFYEKLLLLKDRMNTNYAKKIASHRHAVMEDFLQEFYAEWDGRT